MTGSIYTCTHNIEIESCFHDYGKADCLLTSYHSLVETLNKSDFFQLLTAWIYIINNSFKDTAADNLIPANIGTKSDLVKLIR